jgi:F420-dependent oxidoreductase-like protein
MAGGLKLGLNTGYWAGGPPPGVTESIAEAERLGFDSIWTAEAYGSDCLTPLAWWGAATKRLKLGTAIVQMSARQPAATAMAAMSLVHLSGGRFILGLGVSGPQVVEGWYGMRFEKPLARTREYISILRSIWAREGPVTADGPYYPLPLPDGTGLGKPLKSSIHPVRSDIPIYLGAEGPKNVALAAELFDGWVPLYYSPYRPEVYSESLAPAKDGFEIAVNVSVHVDDDIARALWPIKANLGFYIGGMGAKSRNFHTDLMARMGYEEQAYKIQDLFFEGKREDAIAAVPDAFADEISLVGPKERIAERLDAWRKTAVTTIMVGNSDPEVLRLMADLTR